MSARATQPESKQQRHHQKQTTRSLSRSQSREDMGAHRGTAQDSVADATQHFAERNSEGSSTLSPGPGERAGKQAQGLSLLPANPWLIQSLSACGWVLLMTEVPPDTEATPGTTPVSCPVFSIPMEIPGKLSGQGWWGQAIAPEGTTQK